MKKLLALTLAAMMALAVCMTASASTPETVTTLVMRIDNQQALKTGELVRINDDEALAPVFSQNGRTMVPFRFLATAFGAELDWDGDTGSVIINLDGVNLVLPINSTSATKNGQPVTISEPAQIMTLGRTFVPFRAVSELLGGINLEYDASTMSIIASNGEIDVAGSVADYDDALSPGARFVTHSSEFNTNYGFQYLGSGVWFLEPVIRRFDTKSEFDTHLAEKLGGGSVLFSPLGNKFDANFFKDYSVYAIGIWEEFGTSGSKVTDVSLGGDGKILVDIETTGQRSNQPTGDLHFFVHFVGVKNKYVTGTASVAVNRVARFIPPMGELNFRASYDHYVVGMKVFTSRQELEEGVPAGMLSGMAKYNQSYFANNILVLFGGSFPIAGPAYEVHRVWAPSAGKIIISASLYEPEIGATIPTTAGACVEISRYEWGEREISLDVYPSYYPPSRYN